MKHRIFSVDAETNGLYGDPFVIAVVSRGCGKPTATFLARCKTPDDIDPWVQREVIPNISHIPQTHETMNDMLEDFWKFYRQEATSFGDDLMCVAHCAAPVETNIFRNCVKQNISEREFQAPFPLHDLGTMLLLAGEDPRNSRAYFDKFSLNIPVENNSHDPLSDAWVCMVVAEDLLSKMSSKE